MTTPLEYITTNNLPIKTWLYPLNKSTLQVTGNTFRVTNYMGDSSYDFIQNNFSLHPLINLEGIGFSGNRSISPVSPLFEDVTEYSMIFVTKGSTNTLQTLLSIGKSNTSLPNLLEYKYNSADILQDFSLLSLKSTVSTNLDVDQLQVTIIKHNILLGYTSISVNFSPFITIFNTNKGHILNQINGNFLLGNSSGSIPFLGTLMHFLMFDELVDDTKLLELADLLEKSRSILDASLDRLGKSYIAETSLANTVVFNPSIVYKIPIIIGSDSYIDDISLAGSYLLIVGYFWDRIVESTWNNIIVNEWDTLL